MVDVMATRVYHVQSLGIRSDLTLSLSLRHLLHSTIHTINHNVTNSKNRNYSSSNSNSPSWIIRPLLRLPEEKQPRV
jgi:hypothetical protein